MSFGNRSSFDAHHRTRIAICLATLALAVGCAEKRPFSAPAAPLEPLPEPTSQPVTQPASQPAIPSATLPSTVPAAAAPAAPEPTTLPATTQPAAAIPPVLAASQPTTLPVFVGPLPVAPAATLPISRQNVSTQPTTTPAEPPESPLRQQVKAQPDDLRAVAPLRIPTVALCRRVTGFGVYDAADPQAFRENSVWLYCEVTGFGSRIVERNRWETRLIEQCTLSDEQGQVVLQDQPQPFQDLCRTLRHDFYTTRLLRLPRNLAPGNYTLKVSLTDQLTMKAAETSLPVRIIERIGE